MENFDLISEEEKHRREILKLCENGDIFVQGKKLTENDKEIIDALKQFLEKAGYLK